MGRRERVPGRARTPLGIGERRLRRPHRREPAVLLGAQAPEPPLPRHEVHGTRPRGRARRRARPRVAPRRPRIDELLVGAAKARARRGDAPGRRVERASALLLLSPPQLGGCAKRIITHTLMIHSRR